MVDRDQLLALEERSFRAWPALQVARLDGWLLRFSGGYTKRANSANALNPSGGVTAVLPMIERQYRDKGLTPCIRLTPLAPDGAGRLLDGLGWRTLDETSVRIGHLSARRETPDPAAITGLRLTKSPTPAWMDGFAAASPRPDLRRDTLARMFSAIAQPTAFGTLADANGEAVGYGMAVLDRGMVGLFDIVVPEAHRGRGHGRRLVAGLLAWGAGRGAGAAYLQVTTANVPALTLYDGFGFTEAYRYDYRVPA